MWWERKPDVLLAQAIRFGLVGVCNTVFGLAVIYLCKALGVADLPANVAGYACGLILSFQLHRSWTFADSGKGRAWLAIGFVGAFLIAYAGNLAVLVFLLHVVGLNSYLAQAMSLLAYAIVFYFLSAFFVFRGWAA
jgi:putative flippase GtrA